MTLLSQCSSVVSSNIMTLLSQCSSVISSIIMTLKLHDLSWSSSSRHVNQNAPKMAWRFTTPSSCWGDPGPCGQSHLGALANNLKVSREALKSKPNLLCQLANRIIVRNSNELGGELGFFYDIQNYLQNMHNGLWNMWICRIVSNKVAAICKPKIPAMMAIY